MSLLPHPLVWTQCNVWVDWKKLLIETTLYATKTHNRKNLHELFPRSAYYVEIASKVKTCMYYTFFIIWKYFGKHRVFNIIHTLSEYTEFFFLRLIEIKIWLEKKVDFDFRHFIYIKRTCKYYYLFSFRSDLLKFLISWKIKLSSGGRPYNSPNMPGRRLVLKCISYSNRVCYTLIQHCLA